MIDWNSERAMASYLTAGGVFAMSAIQSRPGAGNGGNGNGQGGSWRQRRQGSTALVKADAMEYVHYSLVGGAGSVAGGMIAGAPFSAGTAGSGVVGGLTGALVNTNMPEGSNRWLKASASAASAGVVTYLVAGLI